MDRMGFKFLGNLHIIVVGERDPAPTDWNAYVEAIRAETRRGIDPAQMRTLVFSDGGGPNAAQRKLTADLCECQPRPRAIVTVHRLSRAVITALRWLDPQCRAFAPSRLAEALAFLGVPGLKLPHVLRLAGEIELGLGISAVKSLEDARGRRSMGAPVRS
jgi:hypothetical protein